MRFRRVRLRKRRHLKTGHKKTAGHKVAHQHHAMAHHLAMAHHVAPGAKRRKRRGPSTVGRGFEL